MTATRAATAVAPLPAFVTGGDTSLLPTEEKLGTGYKDLGRPRPALQIFKAHGWNCIRLRLWVHPNGQDEQVNDLPYTVALGRRVRAAGFKLILDIHYSDTWADPKRQTKPAAWSRLPFDRLTTTMRDYSRHVISAMRAGGAMPDMVQIGNEITGGMLWDDGKNWGPGHDFTKLAVLLKAAERGVAEGSGSAPRPLIIIHIDRGGDWGGTKWFFDGIQAQHVPYDIIGESYYPFWHGNLTNLANTLANAAQRYHKPLIVVETGYAYQPTDRGPKSSLIYPTTPAGQAQFLRDLVATVRRIPGGLGRGVIYWEPEWIPVYGLKSSWKTTTLFDDSGNALPGIDALAARTTTARRTAKNRP